MAKKIAIPSEVEFDFIKSNFFRVIKADGAFGGVAPNGRFTCKFSASDNRFQRR